MDGADFKFDFGDVVSVGGYEGRTFQVEGRRREIHSYPSGEWDEIVYELADVHSLEWLEADEGDMALLAPCDQADFYIEQAPRPAPKINEIGGGFMYGLWSMGGGAPEPRKPGKPTAREISAKAAAEKARKAKEHGEKIDNLLDIFAWNLRKYEATGDEAYKVKVAEVEAELQKFAEGKPE